LQVATGRKAGVEALEEAGHHNVSVPAPVLYQEIFTATIAIHS